MMELKYTEALTEKAQQLASRFGFHLTHAPTEKLYLDLSPTGLTLQSDGHTIQVDFLAPSFQKRLKQTGKKSNFFKAIGNKGPYQIIDMTGGLGRDAFLLAHRGDTVTIIEQSPVVFALLEDGLNRAREAYPDTYARLNLHYGNSLILLKQLPMPDIVYCDPMFPERKKSALVKKDMQSLQTLLGHDDNAEMLLEEAVKFAKKYVVLKRPKLAPVLKNPLRQYHGKTMRFDVYTFCAINA